MQAHTVLDKWLINKSNTIKLYRINQCKPDTSIITKHKRDAYTTMGQVSAVFKLDASYIH